MCVTKISVKLIVRTTGVWGRGRKGPHLPVTDTNRADLRTLQPHRNLTDATLLFTYTFICFAAISPDREFLCLHAPGAGAWPRKAATCERFTARITQFSSERSAFIRLYCNKLALGVSKYFCLKTAKRE